MPADARHNCGRAPPRRAVLLLLACIAVVAPIVGWACCEPEPTEKVFETPYFRIVAPRALFATLDRSGASIDFAVSRRQSAAGFSLSIRRLAAVNGYGKKWTTLEGYFAFVRQPFSARRIGELSWAVMKPAPDSPVEEWTYLAIQDANFAQVSFNYPADSRASYLPRFERMLESVVLLKRR